MTLYEIINPPAPTPPTPEQQAAAQWQGIAQNITGAIRDGMNAISADCTALGKQPILAAMDENLSAAITTAMPILQQLWAACSPNPFPDMPDQPPAPPTPTDDSNT